MARSAPQPDTTIALIFGASRWPDCPKFQDAPSLERSADAFIETLRSQEGLGISWRNIKNLFNSSEDATEQLKQARVFVEQRRLEGKEKGSHIEDLLLYYAGHGDFEGGGEDFYLAIRRTDKDQPLLSSITAKSLGNWCRQTARELRTYLIIDCCFAAAVQHGFMTSPLGLAERRLDQALPPAPSDTDEGVPTSGVALLAAAGLNMPAFAPPGETYSLFTGILLEVLRDGVQPGPPVLSLSDLHLQVHKRIAERYPHGARPELRPLQQ